MTELSNAVTVLIARMESHPEDFEMYGMNKAKFADTAEALYELAGVTEGKGRASAYWFLSTADKEALLEAWKKFHCIRMEKRVMEAIFDDGEAERERELERAKMRQQMYQTQRTAMAQGSLIHPTQNSALQGSSYPYTVSAQQAQGMALFNNASNSTAINASSFTIGKEVIDESLITKLKKWVEEK